MSEENVQLVRRAYSEWAHGNMQGGVDPFDPEIVFESFVPERASGWWSPASRESQRSWTSSSANGATTKLFADEFRDGGDGVFVTGHQKALGRQSGVSVEDTLSSVLTFRNGKVVHFSLTATGKRPSKPPGSSSGTHRPPEAAAES